MGTADTAANPTKRRVRARRGEGERLRADILSAAERLLIETGDGDKVSIRAVANAVGVTPPSIYLHFADKTELLFEVCQVQWRRFEEHLHRAIDGVEDPVDRLRACGRAYVEFGLANPEHYRILFMNKPRELPEGVDMGELLVDSGFGQLMNAVGEAVDTKRFRGDPSLIIFGLWSVVHGLTSLLIAHPDMPWPDRERLVDHLLTTATRGLETVTGQG